jgi:hypothetical protein
VLLRLFDVSVPDIEIYPCCAMPMPRYFFHTRTDRRIFCDRTGLDLPDFWSAPDDELTNALWHEAFAKRLRGCGQMEALEITDESGQVVLEAFLSCIP